MCVSPDYFLQVVEKLFDRIQPWRVLRVHEHIGPKFSCCGKNSRMLMDACIVHQDDNLLGLGLPVNPKFVQDSMQKVVENHGVSRSFGQLGPYDTVFRHSRY